MSDIELINPDQYQQVRSNRYQQTPILHTLQQQQQQQQSPSNSTSPQQQQYSINTSNFPYRRSPLHPTSKLYSQPQQSFNSEWVEDQSYNNSPSKLSTLLELEREREHNNNTNNMAGTSIDPSKFETPSKSSTNQLNFNYINTPVSHHKLDNNNNNPTKDNYTDNNDEYIEKASTTSSSTTIATRLPKVSNWDIFWSMLNDLVGKDKMAKVGQYTLRLLVYHAGKSQTYLSDNNINIKIINDRYNDITKKLNLFKNFLNHPADFIKIIVILFLSIFKQKAAGMINGLSMYRQFLRFGKTPFRIRDLIVKFHNNVLSNSSNEKVQINKSKIFDRKTLGQFLSLYYGINDESILLYKLNVLSNGDYKKFVIKHESIAWHCETWLALYNAYENLQNLLQQEMDLKIQIQVKNKAKQLSKQILLGGNGSNNLIGFNISTTTPTLNNEDAKNLSQIQFKKNNAWIDIYKNLSDLAFNTYTVFNIALPFDTWQIWMGISASVLSTIKLYRETKQKMIEKELGKLKSD
ncbi:peroxin, putative [Candida dubliniensis CD36]|uniref:Peroxisomal membrane protein, putative n=1 Tax=Candida dubliniensis (strain CD36 / ATCC MYA-646 / CBS 7987 / NCPF 3949 / NRRL Y-17841) TaxID=573826 RepID=B9WIY5_CANDC|nr:peroxin, putative [Candida dubliniensis CD36]CAX41203.1 peroxin, putative [Candida dubliniensis CD36]